MAQALEAAETVRARTSPNPWVGAVVVPEAAGRSPVGGTGVVGATGFVGATAPPGGPHAEVAALSASGSAARSATLYVTLEPCAHQGRTPACTEAIIAAGIRRVVVGIEDPDPAVQGRGIAALRAAGIDVEVGVSADEVRIQLDPYLKHRRTGRPWVILKLAATLDGGIAAPDGSSRWITGEAARRDVHRLRSQCDAVIVGAGTVGDDDPSLTVRLPPGDPWFRGPDDQPLRVVLGRIPPGAVVEPAIEYRGDLGGLLTQLGQGGALQVLVEGGARVAHAFHAAGLVDRYVLYLAPALFGGSDGRRMFAGPGAVNIDGLWRGRIRSVTSLEGDLRVELSSADG
jgi:diaminohydroxyphosphoribosylaminopyrimidine deaminase / 5-amino-6-(5-phosphoribosylamino)uracil reductase